MRGKSKADVISKLAIVEEEADETIYWMELLIESKIVHTSRVDALIKETNGIFAMVVASIKTLRRAIRGNFPPIQNRKSKIQN